MEYFYIWLGFAIVVFVLNIAGTVFLNQRITVVDLMLAFLGSLFGPVGLMISFFLFLDAIESRYGGITIWPRKK